MHCESDQASLCWDCDAMVHSANFLVARHSRNLLCRVCQSPTPWSAAGAKLGRTFFVCEQCVGERRGDESGSEDEEPAEDDEQQQEEVVEENQVVPWSPPPPEEDDDSSSSGEDSSAIGGEVVVSRKRVRLYTASSDLPSDADQDGIRTPPSEFAAEEAEGVVDSLLSRRNTTPLQKPLDIERTDLDFTNQQQNII
ncbi:hypothetical protein BUALT_Bualt18G0017600 [Buddleja alternifolia]|uniref:B box-type domain-containing protein n=1 Tax=Buddleja alternifolia TaxID=168488 RepID=A0AAV6W7X1_9LAMI|nr:hypothetical protein BUALT_Bualt18G0017600 [Buddleja alternifolia]